jgi:XTP/dITP diphosphohydrolase
MPSMLIATNNKGKRVEIQALLAELDMQLLTPMEIGLNIEVTEHGQTYAENALLKGRAFCQESGILTLADDSGLEVDALNGAPGLHSARYSPKPEANDADRRHLLLVNLSDFPRPWIARFRCNVAIVFPDTREYLTEGVCPGEIIPEERGQNGFGYDSIFLLPELGLTMAELQLEAKNLLSHRARAIQAALQILKNLGIQRG